MRCINVCLILYEYSNTNTYNGLNFNTAEFIPMSMNDMHLDEWVHQEHVEQLDEDVDKWWTNSISKNSYSRQRIEILSTNLVNVQWNTTNDALAIALHMQTSLQTNNNTHYVLL